MTRRCAIPGCTGKHARLGILARIVLACTKRPNTPARTYETSPYNDRRRR